MIIADDDWHPSPLPQTARRMPCGRFADALYLMHVGPPDIVQRHVAQPSQTDAAASFFQRVRLYRLTLSGWRT